MTIDWWTLAIQTVNVAILVWLLAKFFWRPVAAMIEARRQAAKAMLDEADARREAAAAAEADIARTRAGFDAERQAVLAAARAAAEGERQALLAAGRSEADRLVETARAEMDEERRRLERTLAEEAGQLAVDIARRLAGRLAGPGADAAFLGALLRSVGALPAASLAALPGAPLTVVSASELSEDDRRTVAAALAGALGGEPDLAFATEPALVAGLELRGAHVAVSNSWRADLDRILTDLNHDDRS